jgi:uncharacterized ion transporter superfamily protein YfcC
LASSATAIAQTSPHARRSLDPILLLGALIVVAALLTWILPAGRFERIKDAPTGRTLVVPGSYKQVPRHPIGPWSALMSIPQGLIEAAEVVFFVLLGGAALTVVEATGAIGNVLNQAVRRFGDRRWVVLVIASALFLIGGATENMYEEILAFIPMLCVLMRRLQLGNEMALAISVGTASVAAIFSPFNTFTLGIAQPMAELPLFSGFAFRSVFFVLGVAIWAGYLAWYAGKHRLEAPDTGEYEASEDDADASDATSAAYSSRDMWIVVLLNLGMLVLVLGGSFLHWGLTEFGGVLLLVGILCGLVGGLGLRGVSEHFAEGLRRMAVAAALVGFARSISVVLAGGLIIDTIANVLFSPLRHLPLTASAVTMFLSESALAFPMSSDSGRAVMSLPIIVPLSDLLGISRQMTVLAYQFSSIVSSLITPTAGALLAMLAMADVSYGRWLRFIAVPAALLGGLCAIAMVAGVLLKIQ